MNESFLSRWRPEYAAGHRSIANLAIDIMHEMGATAYSVLYFSRIIISAVPETPCRTGLSRSRASLRFVVGLPSARQ
ncbi:hypothetical protein CH253_07235 [Rhodococcus sp. 06-156-3C]|nr:hypothetical protein CH248_22475 [Rhodococcus sp. 06-156-4a]OZD23658.1 hypothetical protein CH253_07235 [Rhodococcus sp. 06-156-3C]OZD27270.1 hypothetical protein CH247_23145 [Rhodococcus sp. 06-156-3b]OZD31334.1 hypothetical protein CH284_21300 [Rhodococcus sp. 06-156-3]OZF65615.1 hypothetical protein CH290_09195 [Rhodococcus sp. 06-156-4]